jgi:uncharacterized repeat protein (TIGR01451 family)
MIHKLLFLCLLLYTLPALSADILRTITIDGNTSDWTTPTDITGNPGQFSTDAEGDKKTGSAADLDYTIDNTGRDLRTFAYSYDSSFLYFWVERYASTKNITDWWFFMDTSGSGPDGLLQSGEPLLRVSWKGNTGVTTVRLYEYSSVRASGDPLTCPATGINSAADGWCPVAGVADGYDLPGTHGAGITLQASNGDFQNQSGGSASGLEMETKISWAALGFTGPSSLGFHIAASNGQNIPNSTEDNMDGPGGNGGTINPLPDILTLKSVQTLSDPVNGTSSPKAIPGAVMQYTITSTNSGFGAADTDSVTVTDSIPTNTEMFVSDISAAGSGPLAFSDGSTPSALAYSFVALSNTADDIEFSNDGGGSFNYTPVADADGYDSNVTHFRGLTSGAFAASNSSNNPSFSFQFRVRVQ